MGDGDPGAAQGGQHGDDAEHVVIGQDVGLLGHLAAEQGHALGAQQGGVGEGAGQPVHVVVFGEVVEAQLLVNAAGPELAVEGVGNLEIVLGVVGRPVALPALVVGHRVQHLRVGPAGVVPVDDLAHEPELRVPGFGVVLQGPEEVEVHAVGGIQPETVDVETVHPHAHGPQQVIPDLGVFEIELHQLIVASPGLIPEGVPHGGAAAEVQVLEPAAVGGGLALLLHVSEGPEAPAHVIEDAVQHHSDAVLVEGVAKSGEGVHVSQAAVDLVVVGGVVAVLHRLTHRPQIEGVHAQLLEVGNPLLQLFQPLDRLPAGVVLGTAAEA